MVARRSPNERSPWEADPTLHSRRRKDWYNRIRAEAVARYGGCCACCGEATYAFLCLDHASGGGNQHRKAVPTYALPGWLKRNGYPDGFRVLCHNCNHATSGGRACPHVSGDVSEPVVQTRGQMVLFKVAKETTSV